MLRKNGVKRSCFRPSGAHVQVQRVRDPGNQLATASTALFVLYLSQKSLNNPIQSPRKESSEIWFALLEYRERRDLTLSACLAIHIPKSPVISSRESIGCLAR